MLRRISLLFIPLLLANALAACASPATPSAAPTVAPATVAASPTVAEAAPTTASGEATPTTGAAASSEGQILLQLASDGNEARYRVREQLANVDLPSDAIGKTTAVTGSILVNADGSVVSDQSKITVDITGLKSDRDMRDNFLRRSVLNTSRFPTVEFVPTSVTGLPSPLPTSGQVAFKLSGDLTVHGTTKPVTWDVTATATDGKDLKGTATTSFKFADFGLEQPHVPLVLSIEDNIKLEFDFHFVKAN